MKRYSLCLLLLFSFNSHAGLEKAFKCSHTNEVSHSRTEIEMVKNAAGGYAMILARVDATGRREYLTVEVTKGTGPRGGTGFTGINVGLELFENLPKSEDGSTFGIYKVPGEFGGFEDGATICQGPELPNGRPQFP